MGFRSTSLGENHGKKREREKEARREGGREGGKITLKSLQARTE